MILKKYLLSIFFAGSILTLMAQDIHYSSFQMSPLGLNPALAGSFLGTARVGGIYRLQDLIGSNTGTNSASRGYETYSVYVDAPVIRGFRKQDWIGIGLGLHSDVQGIGNLRETGTVQAISYHFVLDKKGDNVLALGVNSGSLSYRATNNFDFEDEITGSLNQSIDDGFVTSLGGGGNGNGNGAKVDWGFGVSYKSKLDKVSVIKGGLSAAHLNRPNKKISMAGGRRIPLRITGFAEYDRVISDRTRIIPALLFQQYSNNTEIALQAMAAYFLDPKKDITVYGGLGLRVNTFRPVDALPIYLGFDMGDVQARLAFDATISRKSLTNRGFGAIEFGVNYIFKIYKRPKVDPAIFCPRF